MIRRMWINQPSTRQKFHHLHGTNIYAEWNSKNSVPNVVVHFLDDVPGRRDWMSVPKMALSHGWLTLGKDIK